VISGHAIYVTLAWAALAMALAGAAAAALARTAGRPAGRPEPRRRIDALPPRRTVTKITLGS
jgi:hypothetical protein